MSKKHAEKWKDVDIDGRRMNRIIRLLETLIKKEKDVDRVVKLANSICYMTSKKLELAYKVMQIDELFHLAKQRERERSHSDFLYEK